MTDARIAEIKTLLASSEKFTTPHPAFHDRHERVVNWLTLCRELLSEVERLRPASNATPEASPNG